MLQLNPILYQDRDGNRAGHGAECHPIVGHGPLQPATNLEPARQPAHPIMLDKNVLTQIRSDMSTTILPTFLSRAPLEVGSASAGSLTAEQWRTFCMVHLVVTLVRIWRILPTTDKRHRALINFVHLVVAARLGTTKQVTPYKIGCYEEAIHKYLTGLRTLFPDVALVPNHHLALHLPENLHAFGPVHSYWTFPFERCIRILRNVNSNFHPSTWMAALKQ